MRRHLVNLLGSQRLIDAEREFLCIRISNHIEDDIAGIFCQELIIRVYPAHSYTELDVGAKSCMVTGCSAASLGVHAVDGQSVGQVA